MGINPQVKKTHGKPSHLQALAAEAMESHTLGASNGGDKTFDISFLHIVQNDREIGKSEGAHVLNLVSIGHLPFFPISFILSRLVTGNRNDGEIQESFWG
jgi:hypothetical protein